MALDEIRPLEFLAGVSHRKGSWLRSIFSPWSPFPALDTLPGSRHSANWWPPHFPPSGDHLGSRMRNRFSVTFRYLGVWCVKGNRFNELSDFISIHPSAGSCQTASKPASPKLPAPFSSHTSLPSVSPSETKMFLRTHPNYCLSQNPTYDSGEQEGLCPDPSGFGLPPRRITEIEIIFLLEILCLWNQKTQAIKSQNTDTWAWRVGCYWMKSASKGSLVVHPWDWFKRESPSLGLEDPAT